METYLFAFLVGGLICGLGQIFLDNTLYLPGHLLVLLVVSGAVLTGLGLYEPLVAFAGAGASVPVSSFGYVLTRGVLMEVERDGIIGLFRGTMEVASGGITASILFGFLIAVIFRPRD